MATITSAASGNWADGGTWVGGVAPGASDIGLIAAGHTVTVAGPLTSAFLVEGSLVINANFTFGANSIVGNGASKDGSLTIGPGVTLAQGAYSLTLNNCRFVTTATSGAWSYITGSGAIARGAVYASPKQEIDISFLSIQTTGAITLGGGGTSGAYTNKRDIQNCAFVGTGAVTIGQGGYSAEPTSDSIINNNDFRDLSGNILLTGYAGACTGARQFRGNTLSMTTSRTFACLNVTTGWDLTGTVMHNVTNGTWTSGANVLDYTFWSVPSGASSRDFVRFSDAKPASTFRRSYIYAEVANAHQIGASGSGGSGTNYYQDLVFETIYATDPANLINIGSLRAEITGCLVLKSAALANVVDAVASGAGVLLQRNTVYKTEAPGNDYGAALWHTESIAGLTDYVGDVDIISNLVAGTPTNAVLYGTLDTTDPAGTINAALNNAFYNVTNQYDHSITTAADDITLVDSPNFVDPTRDLATWDAVQGSGTGTAAAGINYLLAKNGYNSTTKTQSDTPSTNGVVELLAWVRAGFAPQNTVLAGAGYGGVDIGAIDVANTRKFYIARRKTIQWLN